MKKQLIFSGGFVLGICCALVGISLQANAQNETDANIGNPNSDNTIILEQTYGVVSEPSTPSNAQTSDMEPLPDSPNVEVSPPPSQAPKSEEQKPISNNAEMETEIDEIFEEE